MSNAFTNLKAARAAALKQSQQHPKDYVWLVSCFGWMVVRKPRLGVFTPSDATDVFGKTGTYWHNGVEKPFTKKQKVADQNATPTMS